MSRLLNCKDCGMEFEVSTPFVHENCERKRCNSCHNNKKKAVKYCRQCGKETKSIWCNEECKEKYYDKKNKDKQEKSKQRYADNVRSKRFASCVACGQSFNQYNIQRKTCDECTVKRRNGTLEKTCLDCGCKFKVSSLKALRCDSCKKKLMKLRIKKSLNERKPDSVNSSAFRGAAGETIFQLFCDLNNYQTYWPKSGTNSKVDCVVKMPCGMIEVQIKVNRGNRNQSLMYFTWSNSDRKVMPNSCDIVVCVDIEMQAFVVVSCDKASMSTGKTFTQSELLAIQPGVREAFERLVYASMTPGALVF